LEPPGTWHRQTGRWNLTSTYQEEELDNTGFLQTSVWRASMGFFYHVSGALSITAEYVYFELSPDDFLGHSSD